MGNAGDSSAHTPFISINQWANATDVLAGEKKKVFVQRKGDNKGKWQVGGSHHIASFLFVPVCVYH